MNKLSSSARYKLNAVCPYYTMFPLEFPVTILKNADRESVIFDPFCGRGTTNFAAQTYGMKSYGFDSSPIAIAIAKAKLSVTNTESVLNLLETILQKPDVDTPTGEFWSWAFHPKTLQDVCKLRHYLAEEQETDTSVMLRAIALGCLHGPLTKNTKSPSYFSNQMPRTFSSKPAYSVKYWKNNNLPPRHVDVRVPITKKAEMVLRHSDKSESTPANIMCTDSRKSSSYSCIDENIDIVISSPPYYGMQTYVQDQWLRNWLIGGSEYVDYDISTQLSHGSPEDFSQSLADVWNNISQNASPDVKMAIRFGGLGSRKGCYDTIIRQSLEMANAHWAVYYSRSAGSSFQGKRQATMMGTRGRSNPIDEKDYFIRLS
ncbi:putative DNA modification methylase [Alcanivorax sp. MD8A]|uniref:DNA methyltransferase n=1 Tax=Alcanivorax sp. MD8A TaxID=1177157 RepID=UPI000CA729B1|nr:DNA methyltransferase [Alcanivorax sp. MD8A]PNE04263.1 putative DNA modification methylase [Alcanivorax sp. MD8A]